jgi:hypothetical protein
MASVKGKFVKEDSPLGIHGGAGLAASVECRRCVTELIVRQGWVELENLRVNAIKLFMPVNVAPTPSHELWRPTTTSGGTASQAQCDAVIGPLKGQVGHA